jgi:phage tail-like protein
MAFDLPPVGFFFKLHFSGGGSGDDQDAAFREASGLSMNLETREVTEGGQNKFTHHLPLRTKYSDLVLSRGMIPKGSRLWRWVAETLENGLNASIKPENITLQLLDEEQNPICTWLFSNAYPVKWELSGFSAEKSEILVETITFKYNFFKRD